MLLVTTLVVALAFVATQPPATTWSGAMPGPHVIDGVVNATITRRVAQDMSHADFADAPGAMGVLTKTAAEQAAFRERYGRTVAQIVAWLEVFMRASKT